MNDDRSVAFLLIRIWYNSISEIRLEEDFTMKKRSFSYICLLLCLFCLFPALPVSAAKTLVISASEASAMPGENVKITLRADSNPGFNALKLEIGYDGDRLSLESAENEGILKEMMYVGSPTLSVNPYIQVWANAADVEEDGVISILTFRVNGQAAPGNVEVSVKCGFCNDQELKDVAVSVRNGTVRIGGEGQSVNTPSASAGNEATPSPVPFPTGTSEIGTTAGVDPTAELPQTPESSAISTAASGTPTPKQDIQTSSEMQGVSRLWLLLLLLIPAAVICIFLYRRKKK